jgi:hypothetical protein
LGSKKAKENLMGYGTVESYRAKNVYRESPMINRPAKKNAAEAKERIATLVFDNKGMPVLINPGTKPMQLGYQLTSRHISKSPDQCC